MELYAHGIPVVERPNAPNLELVDLGHGDDILSVAVEYVVVDRRR